jgi:hypothetical protein
MAPSGLDLRRAPWLRRVLLIGIAGAALVIVGLSSLGLLPSPGSRAVDDRLPAAQGAGETGAAARPQSPADGAGPAVASAAGTSPVGGSDLPVAMSGVWRYPDRTGFVLGTAGPLVRYRVAVEQGLTVAVADFTGLVDSTLADPRSWIAGGDVRLQRVPVKAAYDFTIYLATPATADELCLQGGVDIRINGVAYTSCRTGNNVVINSARYLNGVPDYGAALVDYRRYVINHEVGHRLGHGHVLCPGAGQSAPVMQQQTLGLQGCVANSWPYVNGRRYSGPPTT